MSSCLIHPSARIHESARLGHGVVIGPDVMIEEDVVIGAYSVIGGMPEHLGFFDDTEQEFTKGVYIERGARIFEFVTIHSGTDKTTHIGQRVAVFNHSHIAHDVVLGDHCVIGGHNSLAGHVHVMERAIVSGKSAIHQWCVIGALAMIAGNSFLKAHVPPGEKWIGSPARPAGTNIVGLNRAGMSFGDCCDLYLLKYEKLKGVSKL